MKNSKEINSKNRMFKRKKCNKCGKLLPQKNKSGFCRHCYLLNYAKKMRIKRKQNKCCVECGRKVKPRIVYPYRCDKCLGRK